MKNTYILKDNQRPSETELVRLYDSVGWRAYTKDAKALKQAIDQSLWTCTLYDEAFLIGLIRVVGDGISIAYVQDILIDNNYQNQGLGTRLLQEALNEFSNVRQFVLLSDDELKTRGFYLKNGLNNTSELKLKAYVKIKN